jgi:hypothetical protein
MELEALVLECVASGAALAGTYPPQATKAVFEGWRKGQNRS